MHLLDYFYAAKQEKQGQQIIKTKQTKVLPTTNSPTSKDFQICNGSYSSNSSFSLNSSKS